MSPVTNVWRQLVQRRLWPVAILLIAALAAVPLMLAKDPEPPVAPPPANVDTGGDLASTPIVTAATADEQVKRRKVLGTAKNPFGTAKPAKAAQDPSALNDATVVKTPSGGSTDGSGSSGGDASAPSTPSTGSPTPTVPSTPTTPATPAPAKKTYDKHELTVRFGGEDSKRLSVKKLDPLPSAEEPVLIYTGVLKDGKVAEFLLDAGVTAIGDGECHPSPEQCETVRLREGETMFLDVKDETGAVVGEYQLDLIEIHKGSGAKASKAKAAKLATAAKASTASRSELRSVAGRVTAFLP
jgi:hypothetical protein